MNKTIMTVMAIAAAVAIAAGAFWAGSYYQRQRLFAGRQFGFPGAGGQGQRFGGPGAGTPGMRVPGDGARNGAGLRGERVMQGRLDKIEDDKLTLTTQFGSIKVTIAENAKVASAKKAALADLKVGKQLIIQSTVAADGQLTAKSIIQD